MKLHVVYKTNGSGDCVADSRANVYVLSAINRVKGTTQELQLNVA